MVLGAPPWTFPLSDVKKYLDNSLAALTTHLQSERTREEMRRKLSGKVTKQEIMRELKLSKSAYYRHLDAIKAEDQEWLKELALDEFVSEYRKAHDMLEELERRLLGIADTAKADSHRIEAIRLCKEVELDRIALLAEGPVALAVRRGVKKEIVEQSTGLQEAA